MKLTVPLLLSMLLLAGCTPTGPSDTAWKNCVDTLSLRIELSADEYTTEEYADELVEIAHVCQGSYDADPAQFEADWAD